jgi:hypothetical protein
MRATGPGAAFERSRADVRLPEVCAAELHDRLWPRTDPSTAYGRAGKVDGYVDGYESIGGLGVSAFDQGLTPADSTPAGGANSINQLLVVLPAPAGFRLMFV